MSQQAQELKRQEKASCVGYGKCKELKMEGKGHIGDRFIGSDDRTNSVKVLKEECSLEKQVIIVC